MNFLGFIFAAHNDILALEANDSYRLNCCIDIAYAVHLDIKSLAGFIVTIGKTLLLVVLLSKNSTRIALLRLN